MSPRHIAVEFETNGREYSAVKLLFVCATSLAMGITGGYYISKQSRPQITLGGGGLLDQLSQTVFPRLVASGSWTGDPTISKLNHVHIDCELERKTCTMMIAAIRSDEQTPYLMLEPTYFMIKMTDKDSLRAITADKDSCLQTTLVVERASKAVTMVRSSEASQECAQWTGYPKTWTLEYSSSNIWKRNKQSSRID
jgi:hypothetical protein